MGDDCSVMHRPDASPRFRRALCGAALLFAHFCVAPLTAQAQAPTPLDPRESSCGPGASPLLILGTYHMANPGFDAHNLDADDPRSPRRQREIDVLLRTLHSFQPTKVAVEAVYGRSAWIGRYRDFLAGKYTLGTNEIEQIGFRLAKLAGLAEISAVDYPMWMDGRIPDEIDYDWKPPIRTESTPTASAAPSEQQLRLNRSTVTEYLQYLNSPESIRENHHAYAGMLRPSTTSNAPFANTDAVTNWYKRNFRIFTNLYRVSTPGTDRVLLLIGAGHLTILQRLAIESDEFCLVDTQAVLRR